MKPFQLLLEFVTSRGISTTSLGIAVVVIVGNIVGLFEASELAILDYFFRRRPLEILDSRIVIVELTEPDLRYLNSWPLTDAQLADLLRKIQQQNPQVIGLDIYRDLPSGEGREELNQVLRSSPNLIGVEKVVNGAVTPNPVLEELNQTALADLVLDRDGKVRRALVAIQDEGQQKLGLGSQVALNYLAAQGVKPKELQSNSLAIRLFSQLLFQKPKGTDIAIGQTILTPIDKNYGSYVRIDNGGYQILINFRGMDFQSVTVREVLDGNIAPDLLTNKIVFIGPTAHSLNDFFKTPYTIDGSLIPGVVIHANITSQIISAALDNRALIQVLPNLIEWLWIAALTVVGGKISWYLLTANPLTKNVYFSVGTALIGVAVSSLGLVGVTYLAFLGGWWLPVSTPLMGFLGAAVVVATYTARDVRRLAAIDGLTQVANRRYFDEQFQRQWWQSSEKKKYLSVILCDVDYFKKYNDTYGHQAGDKCLQQVAQTLEKTVRSTDLVARYGGEEFVILLPKSSPEMVMMVAERIGSNVRNLNIPHTSSEASPWVTLSCGVASTVPDLHQAPAGLVAQADKALYQAKQQGRDRALAYAQELRQ